MVFEKLERLVNYEELKEIVIQNTVSRYFTKKKKKIIDQSNQQQLWQVQEEQEQ